MHPTKFHQPKELKDFLQDKGYEISEFAREDECIEAFCKRIN